MHELRCKYREHGRPSPSLRRSNLKQNGDVTSNCMISSSGAVSLSWRTPFMELFANLILARAKRRKSHLIASSAGFGTCCQHVFCIPAHSLLLVSARSNSRELRRHLMDAATRGAYTTCSGAAHPQTLQSWHALFSLACPESLANESYGNSSLLTVQDIHP